MKNFKQLRQESTHQRYRHKGIFQEGDAIIHNTTGQTGTIHRSGVNYVIAITEGGEMFRAWVKDIRQV